MKATRIHEGRKYECEIVELHSGEGVATCREKLDSGGFATYFGVFDRALASKFGYTISGMMQEIVIYRWTIEYRRREGIGRAMFLYNDIEIFVWELEKNFSGARSQPLDRAQCPLAFAFLAQLNSSGITAQS